MAETSPRRGAVSRRATRDLDAWVHEGKPITDVVKITYPTQGMPRLSKSSDTTNAVALLSFIVGLWLYFGLWVCAWLSRSVTWKELACLMWVIFYAAALVIRRSHEHQGGDLMAAEFLVPLLVREGTGSITMASRDPLSILHRKQARTQGYCSMQEDAEEEEASLTSGSEEEGHSQLVLKLFKFGSGRRVVHPLPSNILDLVGDIENKTLRARGIRGRRMPNMRLVQCLLLGRHDEEDKVYVMSVVIAGFFILITLFNTVVLPRFTNDHQPGCKDYHGDSETVTSSTDWWFIRIAVFSVVYPAVVNLVFESYSELLHLLDYFDVFNSLTTSDLVFLDISGRAVFHDEVYMDGCSGESKPDGYRGERVNGTNVEQMNIIRQCVRTWIMLHRYLSALAAAISPLVERTMLLSSVIFVGSTINFLYSWMIQQDLSSCTEIGSFHVWMAFHILVFGVLTISLLLGCMEVNRFFLNQSSVLANAASELFESLPNLEDSTESQQFNTMASQVSDMLQSASSAIERSTVCLQLYGCPVSSNLVGRTIPLLGSLMGVLAGTFELPKLQMGMLP